MLTAVFLHTSVSSHSNNSIYYQIIRRKAEFGVQPFCFNTEGVKVQPCIHRVKFSSEKGEHIMKMDMHCHTKEGSLDALASMEEYVERLMELGYDGMMITDHNSYKGYENWLRVEKNIQAKLPEGKRFVVLKGIEYDTHNSGHMIIVLPDGVSSRIFEARGLSVEQLQKIVHELGGIIGPAHPYGNGYYAIMRTHKGKKHPEILEKFDFIETFNGKTSLFGNNMADILAKRYNKPGIAGSDSHIMKDMGKVYTIFKEDINCNNDLIDYILAEKQIQVGGEAYKKLYRFYTRFVEKCGIGGYWVYNKVGTVYRTPARKRAKKEFRSKYGKVMVKQ